MRCTRLHPLLSAEALSNEWQGAVIVSWGAVLHSTRRPPRRPNRRVARMAATVGARLLRIHARELRTFTGKSSIAACHRGHGTLIAEARTMKWHKSPNALVQAFNHCLPVVAGVERKAMFGYPCAFVNGHLFCGLHQDGIIVHLAEARRDALVAEGASRFEPMPGQPMKEFVVLPPEMVDDRETLRALLGEALAQASSLAPKAKKVIAAKKSASPKRMSARARKMAPAKKAPAKKRAPVKKASPKRKAPTKKALAKRAAPAKRAPAKNAMKKLARRASPKKKRSRG